MPGGSHVWQPFTSPYYVEIGPLLPGWSLGPRPHSPSKSKSTTWSREVQFNMIVTKANRLIGPHKTRHAVSTQLKACHRGQNGTVLNRRGRGLAHRNLRIATSLSSPFPSEGSTDPLTFPTRSSNSNINIPFTHHNRRPSSSWKEGSYMRVGPTTRLLPMAINYA
jgi:hypothetical protein